MKKLGIYGTGNIGSCLATLTTGNGFATIVTGHSPNGMERCQKTIGQNWDDLVAAGKAAQTNKNSALSLLTISDDAALLSDCDFVFEAVAEKIEIKREVYARIEKACSPDTVIASCTSSLTAAELSGLVEMQERFILTHPFQPAHIQPLVEVVRCARTTDETERKTVELLERLDRQVVRLSRDIPGLIVNRLAQTMFRESLYLIEQGVTTAADIDKAVRWAVGKRYASIGLLEYFDFVGFRLEHDIAANVYPTLCASTTPQDIVLRGLASGETGVCAGKGLYDWSQKDTDDFRHRRQAPFFASVNWTMPGNDETTMKGNADE